MTFSEIILKGMNNPDCSFFVGQMVGSYATAKLIIFALVIMVLYKLIDKLVILPIIEKLKKIKKNNQ